MKPALIIRIAALSALVHLTACGDTTNNIRAGSIDTSSCSNRVEWIDESIEVPQTSLADVCSVIDNYREKRVLEAIAMMEAPCPNVDKMAASVGGASRLRQLVDMGELDHDQNAKGIVAFCLSSQETKKEFLESSLEPSWANSRVYSVGKIHINGSACSAGIVVNASSGNEVLYLVGSGEQCLDIYSSGAKENAYHPVSNEEGILPGDYFLSEYHYSGPMPKKFSYRSMKYNFLSGM